MEKKNSPIIKVAVIGPESSGKSVLCEQLAAHFNTVFVKEFARSHLTMTGGKYQFKDLVYFAQKQNVEVEASLKIANKILFCDTDLHNIKVWSLYEFKRCDPWLLQAEENQLYDFYLLCRPDIPWIKDDLRQNAHLRDELFAVYLSRLQEKNRSFGIVSGIDQDRLECAKQFLLSPFAKDPT